MAQRYRGSLIGGAWALVQPLVMLAVYYMFFGLVFQARWGTSGAPRSAEGLGFATLLFIGLVLHALMAECLTRAPGLVRENANLVKKLVFPLEVLVWPLVGQALFHAAIGLAIALAFALAGFGRLPAGALWLPVVLLPYLLTIAGLTFLLAALGVFLRDLGQIVTPVVTALLFFSPVFVPPEILPESWRAWLHLNPLTLAVEQARAVAIWGETPNWGALAIAFGVGLAVALSGAWAFRRLRHAFADLL